METESRPFPQALVAEECNMLATKRTIRCYWLKMCRRSHGNGMSSLPWPLGLRLLLRLPHGGPTSRANTNLLRRPYCDQRRGFARSVHAVRTLKASNIAEEQACVMTKR